MKKIVFSALALILIANLGFGQNEKFFRFGLHGNTGLTWMKSDEDSVKYDGMRLGVGYGFAGEITIADNFSFATGIDVSYVGGKLKKEGIMYQYPSDTNSTLSTINTTYRFQYLDIPLTIKMKTNEINYITYFARVGASLGINLKARGDEEYASVSGADRKISIDDINLKDERKFFRANFIVGGGIEYSLGGTTTALAEISFINGLTSILDDINTRNNYLQLKVGVMF